MNTTSTSNPTKVAICRLLETQVNACGAMKSIGVLQTIVERIIALGGQMQPIAVREKSLLAIPGYVKAALNASKFLDVLDKNGITQEFEVCITSAFSDVYKTVTSTRVLSSDIAILQQETQNSAILTVTVGQYTRLIEILPILCRKNPFGNLWLKDRTDPTKPNPKLIGDLEKLCALAPYLTGNVRGNFERAVEHAKRVLTPPAAVVTTHMPVHTPGLAEAPQQHHEQGTLPAQPMSTRKRRRRRPGTRVPQQTGQSPELRKEPTPAEDPANKPLMSAVELALKKASS